MTVSAASVRLDGTTIMAEVKIGQAKYTNAVALRDAAPGTVASGMRLISAWVEGLTK